MSMVGMTPEDSKGPTVKNLYKFDEQQKKESEPV